MFFIPRLQESNEGQTRLSIQHHNFATLPYKLLKGRGKILCKKMADLSPASKTEVIYSHLFQFIIKLGRGKENWEE